MPSGLDPSAVDDPPVPDGIRALIPLSWVGTPAPTAGRCVFIDRDGVVNERCVDGYVMAWEDFVWREGVVVSLKRLVDRTALPLVVVTNQACIGRGLVDAATIVDIQDRMREALAAQGVPVAAWYCCPHRPDEGCACRKPRPGMLERCSEDLNFRLQRSYLVGDSPSDIEAGRAVGCATWHVSSIGDFDAAITQIIEREKGVLTDDCSAR